MSIPTCAVTGLIAGDSDACGDCDPCIIGAGSVPDVVKRLLKDRDEWREKYSDAMTAATDDLHNDVNDDCAMGRISRPDVIGGV